MKNADISAAIRSMTPSGMEAPRSPPTSRKDKPEQDFRPCPGFGSLGVTLRVSRTSRETLQVPSGLRRADPWSYRRQEPLRYSQRMRRLNEDGHLHSAR